MSETREDISVVCTLYKRPESLVKQLESIYNQTLKVKDILLFQDAIEGDYKIEISDELKKNFTKIKFASENMGVWERFRFAAMEVETEYVCLLDDDTIPGENWFKNCVIQMKIKEGIFGTNGIVMTDNLSYPKGGYFPVGWKGPVRECTEVDFVGHAWFLKTEWLKWMFEGTEELQELKYVAEDMCLSVMAKQHGVRTFVPPHPSDDTTLWGSSPIFGDRFGNAIEALSFNMNNLDRMQKAVLILNRRGWQPLCLCEPEKVTKAKRNRKREDRMTFYIKVIGAVKRRIRI